ncbi:SpoIVB peptidase S55 domain-containing protein [soil metagenome]
MMRPAKKIGRIWWPAALAFLVLWALVPEGSRAGEPDPSTYWDVREIRPGMKGTGQTVMVGTALEEFEAEVLGVLRDVSPGRDMVLCRLSGCNLEHAGIIQGMSGSPIYIDGKLLGAVAYAWEFAKDPIAGVTPFSQMVQYSRSGERRFAAESGSDRPIRSTAGGFDPIDWSILSNPADFAPRPTSSAGLGGMKPIATPVSATGFGPAALAVLEQQLGPLGMAPVAGGGAFEEILHREGDKPLTPGAPLSVAMVIGDFDISGIGTVTHVEGDRVYGFGHPMLGLGSCELPLMSGYIHTVYPRASVSMKMGSPLKVIGVLDTDVSTGVAGRLGPGPDLLPMSVKVKVGRYSEPTEYNVEIVREPKLLPGLVMSVLTNAVDTEGNLPDELTADISVRFEFADHEPIVIEDRLSGPRYSGPLGPSAMFSAVSSVTRMLVQNPMEPIRIESISCEVRVDAGRLHASIESVRLASDRLQPGEDLRAFVTLKPFKGDRETIEVVLPLPNDLAEGDYEAILSDMGTAINRRLRNEPPLRDPRDLAAILRTIRFQADMRADRLYLHVPLPNRGLAVRGQSLPNLPGSVRALLSDARTTPAPALRADLTHQVESPWVVEGSQTLKFRVVKDTGLSMRD